MIRLHLNDCHAASHLNMMDPITALLLAHDQLQRPDEWGKAQAGHFLLNFRIQKKPLVAKRKACVRCRKFKKGCDFAAPCQRCKRAGTRCVRQ